METNDSTEKDHANTPLKLMLGDQKASICQLETDGIDESLIW